MTLPNDLSHSVLEIANSEISRILFHLGLLTSYSNRILSKFKRVWSILNPKHTFRDPELLPPLIIFLYCKFHEIPIDTEDLLNISRMHENLFLFEIFQIFEFLITERQCTLSDLLVENEYWFEDFKNFLYFLSFYTRCSLCQGNHRKEYLIAFYFQIKPSLTRKLISNTTVNLKCISKKSCIFLKESECKIGVPCNKCRMEYFRKKEPAKD